MPALQCAGPLCKKRIGQRIYCSGACKKRASVWRRKGVKRTNKKCDGEGCNNRFMQRNSKHRFCSSLCRKREREGVIKKVKVVK